MAIFQWLVLGWVQCQGLHTLADVALASGAIGQRHISVFHRFFHCFSRAAWSLDASRTWSSRGRWAQPVPGPAGRVPPDWEVHLH
jgi:hypothetical protein